MGVSINPEYLALANQVQSSRQRERGLGIQLAGIHKAYGERGVLHDIDLDVPAGQFVTIVGRSGCGKSTLLRLIAGLEGACRGDLRLDQGGLAQHREELRIMFQDARLLPWKTVVHNVALGLPGSRRAIREVALEALDHVGLVDRADEWPGRLSGGQRQRVALARALVHRPRLLLLGEPLGALDALTRIEMQALIEKLWREEGFTALLVTHDVAEAVALGDRVLLIDDGKLSLDQEVDFSRPREPGSARFAALEEFVLSRVLKHPAAETLAPEAPYFTQWCWAT
jgi:sulfonate transport system ATP-binding protein